MRAARCTGDMPVLAKETDALMALLDATDEEAVAAMFADLPATRRVVICTRPPARAARSPICRRPIAGAGIPRPNATERSSVRSTPKSIGGATSSSASSTTSNTSARSPPDARSPPETTSQPSSWPAHDFGCAAMSPLPRPIGSSDPEIAIAGATVQASQVDRYDPSRTPSLWPPASTRRSERGGRSADV